MDGFRFQEDGDARSPALLLANSLLAGNAMWDAQAPVWSQRYRVLRFHYAGHGAASVPVAFTDAASLATFVLEELTQRGIDRFHVAGLSLGGMLGLQLASQAPARVDRLVIANCRSHQPDAVKAVWTDRIARVRDGGVDAVLDETMERWFTGPFRVARPDAVEPVRSMMRGVSSAGYQAAAAMVRDFDARPHLGAIAAPTLVITGAQDSAAPVGHMRDLAAELKAEFVAFEACAHLSSVERADAFTDAVSEFLAR